MGKRFSVGYFMMAAFCVFAAIAMSNLPRYEGTSAYMFFAALVLGGFGVWELAKADAEEQKYEKSKAEIDEFREKVSRIVTDDGQAPKSRSGEES